MESELKAIRTLEGQLRPLLDALDPATRRALGIKLPAERELLTALERLHDGGHSALSQREAERHEVRKQIRLVELKISNQNHDRAEGWQRAAHRDAIPQNEWQEADKKRAIANLKEREDALNELNKERDRLQRALAKLEA